MAKPIVNIKLLADLSQFSSQMQNVSRKMQKTSRQFKTVGTALSIGLTAPIVAFGVKSVRVFAEFNQEMAKVKAVSGATGQEFKALEIDAKKLGSTTRYTAGEVAGLQLNFSKLGFNPKEILNATAATLDLALATGEDLAESATVAASTLRGFGISAKETVRITDVMAKSFSSSALDLTKFSTAMGVLAPVAKTANVSLEESVGMLSVLANAGVDASTAGTGLRNMFLDLADKGLSLDEALSQIQNSTNKNKTAMDLFGKRGATVANIIADNIVQARELAESYRNSGGAAKAMADIMDDTLQGAFFRLKSAIEGAQIAVGEQLAPILIIIADRIGEVVVGFTELSPVTKKFILVLAGVAAAVGPLLALAGAILPAIGTGFALLTGPIGLVVAGLTAVGVIIYKNWKPIKQTLIDIANYFVDLYNESIAFRIAVENVSSAFKSLLAVGKYVFSVLGEYMNFWWKNVKNGVRMLGDLIRAVLTGDIKAIPGIISEGLKKGWNNGMDALDGIKEKFKPLKEAIQENIEEGLDNALNGRKRDHIPDVVDSEVPKEKTNPTPTGSGRARVGTIDTSGITQGMIESPLKLAAETIGTHVAIIDEQLAKSTIALNTFKEVLGTELPAALSNFGESFIDSLGLADHGFEGFVKNMAKSITKFISMMLSQAIAGSITNSVVSASGTGPAAIFTQPAFMATLVGGVISAFAAIPKFETGGVVGGSSFYGDRILARVNSEELILNRDQTRRASELIDDNSSSTGGQVVFEIKGDTLIGVMKKSLRGNSRSGGNFSLS